MLGLNSALLFADPKPVELVYTNPGEDCANSVRLSWHTTEEKSTVYYSKAADTEYKHAKKIASTGVNTPVAFHDGEQYYRWWSATQNPPDNGPEVMRSNFWFKYDSILFIGIDSIDTSYLNQQKEWFEEVLKKMKALINIL